MRRIDDAKLFGHETIFGHVYEKAERAKSPRCRNGPTRLFPNFAIKCRSEEHTSELQVTDQSRMPSSA